MPFAAVGGAIAAGAASAAGAGAIGAAAAGAIGSAVIGDVVGGSGGSSAGSGAANVIGGGVSLAQQQQEATQVENTAAPYNPYYGASAAQLAAQAANGSVGSSGLSGNTTTSGLSSFVNGNSAAQTGALNGVGTQLANLIANPNSVTQTAGYQASLNQGLAAGNAGLAASGLNGSGNQAVALTNYANTFQQNAYNTQFNQLSAANAQNLQANQQQYNQASGVNTNAYNQQSQLAGLSTGSLSEAAQAQANVYTGEQQAASQVGQGVGQLLNGLSGNSATNGTTSQLDPALGPQTFEGGQSGETANMTNQAATAVENDPIGAAQGINFNPSSQIFSE